MGQHVEVGLDAGGEGVVDFAAEGGVAVELRAALQEADPLGQQLADALVAAEDIDLVDALDAGQRPQNVAHEGFATQQAEVLAAHALAVEAYGYECYGFHLFRVTCSVG